MALNDQFRSVLEAGDVARVRRGWAEIAPHLPQPQSDAQAEVMMHHARTQAESVSMRARAWSHRWLAERNLPSGLPDKLKPEAERMYPREVGAVGIACKTRNPDLAPAAMLIRGAMEEAVQHCYADGRTEPVFVKEQMMHARKIETKRLFGHAWLKAHGR